MPNTPIYGFSSPEYEDPPDVPADLQTLAEEIETVISAIDVGLKYSQTIIYTVSGTFSKADFPDLKAIRARVQAAGGGGGGTNATASGAAGVSGGGAGGEFRAGFVFEGNLSVSEVVTVGSGGTGGPDHTTAGTAGGNSSFGSHIVANGGSGGASNNAGEGFLISSGGDGGSGGSGGFDVTTGSDGTNGYRTGTGSGDGRVAMAGHGGGSRMAGMKRPSGATAGTGGNPDFGNGKQYGGGGGGGFNNQNQGSVARGGHGANGIVMVDIFV
jgi:hypothetical protein